MSIYNFEVKDTKGELRSLKDYEGKVVLIVNTASKCGFTPQFEGLQQLYNKYAERGLVILGFPCSQFNNQEFETIDETTQFCQMNYGVTFPMFAKIDVNGEHADPLFSYLKEQKRGLLSRKIEWNFTKFLVDRQGQVVKRFAPTTAPEKLEQDIVRLL
ncbi:glutathione peroxidase [Paenibacillus montaniterrae]|uniref:Glutathione peroxidase n=1 Tax=Paenibacillus montaniterrae TaxID=429341 RepID=A0A920D0J7_9BACL|nr:glutathione peroxidase [Paenibacillus montaniterrae]GIP18024.1 glutathione peroxidase [Paenibacillus montaniterrae]